MLTCVVSVYVAVIKPAVAPCIVAIMHGVVLGIAVAKVMVDTPVVVLTVAVEAPKLLTTAPVCPAVTIPVAHIFFP